MSATPPEFPHPPDAVPAGEDAGRGLGFVGVDGGGTASRAVVLDGAGKVRARVGGGPALLTPGGEEALAGRLVELVRAAWGAAALGAAPAGVCCGLAGAGRAAGREMLERALRRGFASAASGWSAELPVRVVSDAEAAFHDVYRHGPGLLLVAGTGSIAVGRGPAAAPGGALARVGGWGALLGDEGSAYAIGHGALRAVARAADGRGPPTALTDVLLHGPGRSTPEDLVDWAAGASKNVFAALAPQVLRAAAAGDGAAREVVGAAVTALGLHVSALRRRTGPWPGAAPLALAGGLLAGAAPLRTDLLSWLEGTGVVVSVRADEVDAARGAAALAAARASD